MENINYKWIISATPCKPKEGVLENVVSEIHWRLEAYNENYTAETYGVVNVYEPIEENFTPYESLTKDQVVSWVIKELGEKLEKIKENLNNDLFLQANPVKVSLPLPFIN